MKYLLILVNRRTNEKKVVKNFSCGIHKAANKMLDYVKKHNVDMVKFYPYLKKEEL